MSDDLRIEEIDDAIDGLTHELRQELYAAKERIVQLEMSSDLEMIAAKDNKIQILEKQIELLEAVVRYWKWRVVGNEDVAPGEEYLIEER